MFVSSLLKRKNETINYLEPKEKLWKNLGDSNGVGNSAITRGFCK